MSCQLSVTISKTLSACITENCEYHSQKHIYIYVNGSLRQIKSVSVSINSLFFLASLASGLAQYGVVSHLFSLLVSPHLDPEDRLSVLLTLGHCTETSGKTAQSCWWSWIVFPLYILNISENFSHYSSTVFLPLRVQLEYLCYSCLFFFYNCVFLPVCRGAPVPVGAVWRPSPHHNPPHRGYK